MLKFDNTCTEYPNMTRVLDEMLYSKRKKQKEIKKIKIKAMMKWLNYSHFF